MAHTQSANGVSDLLAHGYDRAKAHLSDPVYRNGYFLMLNSVTGALFGFAFWLVAARIWSPAQVGWGAGVVSAMTLLALLSKFGLDAGLIRYVPTASADARRHLIRVTLVVSGILGLVVGVGFLALVPWLMPELRPLLDPVTGGAFLVFAVAIGLGWTLDAYFVAEQRAEFSFLRNLVFNGLKLALPFLVIVQATAFGIPLAWGLGTAASVVLSLAIAPALVRRATGEDGAPGLKRFLAYCGKNYVHNVSEFLPGLVFPLMVLAVLGPEANARFYIAWTMAFVAFLASKSVSQSVFAELSQALSNRSSASQDDSDDSSGAVLSAAGAADESLSNRSSASPDAESGQESPFAAMKKGVFQHALVLGPFILGSLFLGRFALGLFGEDYAAAYPLLVVLALSSVLVGALNLYLVLLKVLDAGVELVVLPLLLVAGSLGAAPLLLPAFGVLGAGLAWFATTGVLAAWSVPRTFLRLRRWNPD